MDQQLPKPPSFDQIVKGNINIKQLCNKNKVKINKYKITFNKIGKFLKYQTWSDSNETLNEHRKVNYQIAKIWIQQFNNLNASLKNSIKPLFTPTTVMEIGNNKYIFVIYKAKINFKNEVVFIVSTQDIALSSSTFKQLLNIPCGRYDNVRFDIDAESPRIIIFIGKQDCSQDCQYIYIPIPTENTTENPKIYVNSAHFIDYKNKKEDITKKYEVKNIWYINFFDQVIKNVRYEENITDDDTEKDNWATFTTTFDDSITVEDLVNLETKFPDQVKKYDNPPQYRVFGNLQFFDSVDSDSE
jgi:hypothetical protein